MRLPAAAAIVALLAVPAAVVAQEYPLPEQEPAPAAAPLAPLEPIPALRRAIVIDQVRGRVKYRLPGETRDRTLRKPTAVPMRTVVDATAGRVRLTVERDTKGRIDEAVFFDGRFSVAQGAGRRPITHLRLVGEIPACNAAARTSARRKRRRLWGDGKGRFRTRGRYSAATVRGTKWLVEDQCDGTLTRVARGEVEVIDYAPVAESVPPAADQSPAGAEGAPAPTSAPQRGQSRPRRVRVRRGGSYVARPG